MRNHANENITEFEIRTVRARRHETKYSTPAHQHQSMTNTGGMKRVC